MGERFYIAQKRALGTCPGDTSARGKKVAAQLNKPKKYNKKELVEKLEKALNTDLAGLESAKKAPLEKLVECIEEK